MKLKFELLPIIFSISYYCLPIVFINVQWYGMLAFILVYVFTTAIISGNQKVISSVFGMAIMILLYACLIMKLGDIYTTEDALSRVWSLVTCIFPVYLVYRIITRFDKKSIERLIWLAMLMYIVTALLTMKELLGNPSACRIFSLQTGLYKRNIGHFDFVYATPVMIVLFRLMAYKFPQTRVLYTVFTVVAFGTILLSGYTLALLTTITVLGYIFLKKNNYNQRTTVKAISAFFILLLCFPFILRAIISLIPHQSMSIRLNEIYNAIYIGDNTGYNMNGRIDLYVLAIQAFFKGFFSGNRELGFPPHSSFLSVAAHTGIWGVLTIFYIFKRNKRRVENTIGGMNISFNAAFLALLITGFTNPLFNCYLHCFTVFCLVPLASYNYGDFIGGYEYE